MEYRKAQLKRLQEEVVDIEDMSDGISIMDLGLNEFRLDLLDYIKHNGDLDKKPRGLHAVVPATDELPEGVIFVLKTSITASMWTIGTASIRSTWFTSAWMGRSSATT